MLRLRILSIIFEVFFGQNKLQYSNEVAYFFLYGMEWYGMEIFYLTKITEVQINDTINKYIMNISGDYT